MFTTVKIGTGFFECHWNGEKTKYTIFNGSRGMSGYGNNIYGIENYETGKIVMIGSLQKTKKMVEFSLTKQYR